MSRFVLKNSILWNNIGEVAVQNGKMTVPCVSLSFFMACSACHLPRYMAGDDRKD